MTRCKRLPRIRTVSVAGTGTPAELVLPVSTAAFVLRPRTAVGITIRTERESADYFSLAAGETYAEESMQLGAALSLWLDAASAVVVEVWSWEG